MVDYKVELKKGLMLEDSSTFIEWNISQEELFEKIGKMESFKVSENDEFNYRGYTIQAKIFGSLEDFWITINFVKSRMMSISIGKQNNLINVEDYFCQMQEFLQEKFGKPNDLPRFTDIFKSKGDRTYRWKIGKILIVHLLFDMKLQSSLEIRV